MSQRLQATRLALLGAGFIMAATPDATAQTPPPGSHPPPPQAILRLVVVEGSTVFSPPEVGWLLHLKEGESLPGPPGELGDALARRYADEGYTCAEVRATFDEPSGRFVLQVDEGRIDDIDFAGVEQDLAGQLRSQLEVKSGDIYNRREVNRAVDRVLEPTRGALRRVGSEGGAGSASTRSPAPDRRRDGTCGLVEKDGRRVLVISLKREAGKYQVFAGADGREDWYSPVDGLAPGLGIRATLFDQKHLNHTFLTGYVTVKLARDRAAYSLGLERPLTHAPRLFVGAELHDLTASDDDWRLSGLEQSLVALGFKESYRDYYERRGYQLHAAVQIDSRNEVLIGWRDERHENLTNETDYSFFGSEGAFRPNAQAGAGRLRAILLGYTFDSREDVQDPLVTYHRHLLDGLFGSQGGPEPGARVQWTSELALEGLGGDLAFRRHTLNARSYLRPSPRQSLSGRLLVGLAGGVLPPQRTFALGGIGSVHGYNFKEAAGSRMVLLNAEYQIGLSGPWGRDRPGMRGLVFFDAGRVFRPLVATRDDWLLGVGLGVAVGDLRVDFGWRLNDIPQSFQVLVRLGPTF